MFKKSDLKTGMIVEMGDGLLRLVIGETLVSVVPPGGGLIIPALNDNLEWKESQSMKNRVMKVYSEPKGYLQADLRWWFEAKESLLAKCKLLWERNATIDITVKVNGNRVPLKDISCETLLSIRNNS